MKKLIIILVILIPSIVLGHEYKIVCNSWRPGPGSPVFITTIDEDVVKKVLIKVKPNHIYTIQDYKELVKKLSEIKKINDFYFKFASEPDINQIPKNRDFQDEVEIYFDLKPKVYSITKNTISIQLDSKNSLEPLSWKITINKLNGEYDVNFGLTGETGTCKMKNN